MDALIQEFFRIMNTVSQSRDELERVADLAARALLIAEAVDDPVTLKSASFATKRQLLLDIRGKNIMGIPVPIIEKKSVSLSVLERGYSIIGVSGRIDEVAEMYETELDLVIGLAETETALRRLGQEIQMNRRRVNALEQVLIPELKRQAKYIKITIEERETRGSVQAEESETDARAEEEGKKGEPGRAGLSGGFRNCPRCLKNEGSPVSRLSFPPLRENLQDESVSPDTCLICLNCQFWRKYHFAQMESCRNVSAGPRRCLPFLPGYPHFFPVYSDRCR